MDTRTRKDGRAVKGGSITYRRSRTRPCGSHVRSRQSRLRRSTLIRRLRSGAAARSAGGKRLGSHPTSLHEGGARLHIPTPFSSERRRDNTGLPRQMPESDALPNSNRPSPAPRGGAGRGGEQTSLSPGERVRESALQSTLGGARGRSGAQPTNWSFGSSAASARATRRVAYASGARYICLNRCV